MTIIVPDSAEVALLDGTWSGLSDDLDLRLFTNDVTSGLTPAQIDALDETDFTEATFTGYAAVALLSAGWTITSGNPTTGAHSQQSFISTADQTAQTIRGYYVTDNVSGAIRWFEKFPSGPVVVEFTDDEILITPTLTLDDQDGNEMSIGSMKMWPFETPEPGWLLCDGQAVSRSTFPLLDALMAADGYPHGDGDGSTTFNLPDLQGRHPLGVTESGTGSVLGETGGAIDHVHDLDTPTSAALVNIPTTDAPILLRRPGINFTADRQGNASGSGSTQEAMTGAVLVGESDAENAPYLASNFVIKAT